MKWMCWKRPRLKRRRSSSAPGPGICWSSQSITGAAATTKILNFNKENKMTYTGGSNPGVDMAITFIYFRDLPKAMEFYENVMGFKLAIDQGFCKIYRASANGYVGLVDSAQGFHKASDTKPIILCYRVPDVDKWYEFIKGK